MRFSTSAVVLLAPAVLGASIHRNGRRACVVNGTSGNGADDTTPVVPISDSVTLTASATVGVVLPSVSPAVTESVTLSVSAPIVAQPTPSCPRYQLVRRRPGYQTRLSR